VNVVSSWPVGSLATRISTELVLNLVLTAALRPVVRMAVQGMSAGELSAR
jgi:hypothetical protein